MLLVIDAGNSDIVFALAQGKQWLHYWRVPSTEEKTPADYEVIARTHFLEQNLRFSDLQNVVISSVVPDLTNPLKLFAEHLLNKPPIVLGNDIYPYLPLKILNPREIGTDLVANALAVSVRYSTHCLIVDFGTALTFTVVSSGEIVGVSIVPGLKTAVRALSQHTAQLFDVPLQMPESAIGKNTVHAIQAGILYGYVGLVSGMIERIEQELGGKLTVVATGGLSSILTPLQARFDAIDKMLTLDGLRLVAEIVLKN